MRTSYPSFRSKSITEKLVPLKLGCALITIQVRQHVSAGNCRLLAQTLPQRNKQRRPQERGHRPSGVTPLSVMKELNMTERLDGRKHQNADLFTSTMNRLQDRCCHICNTLAFNGAKPLKKQRRSYFFPAFKNCHSLSCKHHWCLHKPDAVIRNRDGNVY